MNSPLIVMFLGYPGSGKTTFARQLALALPAVTLNSDALRVAMFGSRERLEQIRVSDPPRVYQDVFGAMEYATGQIVRSGTSVIYDAQMTKRADRQRIVELATDCGARPVLVWMQTDEQVAIRRGVERDDDADSHRYDEALMRKLIKLFHERADLPTANEQAVEISGQRPFPQQLAAFRSAILQDRSR